MGSMLPYMAAPWILWVIEWDNLSLRAKGIRISWIQMYRLDPIGGYDKLNILRDKIFLGTSN